MATRSTKRGSEKTDLTGSYDVLVCGASFAGLAAASMLRGTGARTLVIEEDARFDRLAWPSIASWLGYPNVSRRS